MNKCLKNLGTMKNLIEHKTNVFSPLLALLFASCMVVMSCSKDDAMLDVDAPMDMDYQKVHLVSSEDGYGASVVDPNLVNAWGMAVEPTGNYWISSTDQDLTTIYDYKGMISTLPITYLANQQESFTIPLWVLPYHQRRC